MSSFRKTFSIYRLVFMAMLAAIQIILSRYLSIQASSTLRISVETVPIMLAGLWLGPVCGAIVALCADILGTILSGYGLYFIWFSIGPVVLGILSGFFGRFLQKGYLSGVLRIVVMIAFFILLECLTSLLYGTLSARWYATYMSLPSPTILTYLTPFTCQQLEPYGAVLLRRLPAKAVTIPLDALLTTLVYRLTYRQIAMKIK